MIWQYDWLLKIELVFRKQNANFHLLLRMMIQYFPSYEIFLHGNALSINFVLSDY